MTIALGLLALTTGACLSWIAGKWASQGAWICAALVLLMGILTNIAGIRMILARLD